jgi:hypothetical protein
MWKKRVQQSRSTILHTRHGSTRKTSSPHGMEYLRRPHRTTSTHLIGPQAYQHLRFSTSCWNHLRDSRYSGASRYPGAVTQCALRSWASLRMSPPKSSRLNLTISLVVETYASSCSSARPFAAQTTIILLRSPRSLLGVD